MSSLYTRTWSADWRNTRFPWVLFPAWRIHSPCWKRPLTSCSSTDGLSINRMLTDRRNHWLKSWHTIPHTHLMMHWWTTTTSSGKKVCCPLWPQQLSSFMWFHASLPPCYPYRTDWGRGHRTALYKAGTKTIRWYVGNWIVSCPLYRAFIPFHGASRNKTNKCVSPKIKNWWPA